MRLSQRSSAILVLTRRLVAETDADRICRDVLETAEQQLEGAHALLVDRGGGDPVFTIRTAGPRAMELRHAHLLGSPVSAGFGWEVLGSPGVTSVLLDPRFGFDAALIDDGMRAATVVPVATGGPPQPVLLLAWPDARECQPEDLWFVENLGVQLGLAFRNARVHADLAWTRLSLRSAERDLARAEQLRAVGDLASGLVHQFNNALTSILGLADWLLSTLPVDAAGRSELVTIRAAAVELAELIERLRGLGSAPAMAESAPTVAEAAAACGPREP
jgi:signal transduction histidine kinase